MFNSLREELNKIALMENDDLEYYNDYTVDGDEGPADDELYDDIEESEEEEEFDDLDGGAVNEAVDAIINELIINEGYYNENGNEFDDDIFDDDYEDDDFDDDDDDLDMDYGVVGDGKTVKGEPEDDEYDSVDIGGVTNSIHDLKEDIDDDEEDDLDELLESILNEGDHQVQGNANDIYGDNAEMPDGDVPPAPQYSRIFARDKVGRPIPGYGQDEYMKFGNASFSKDVMNNMTVDDDAYDEEGNAYDLYASAGNIYDDDENEEYYGIRNKVATNNLYGRHNINNINNAQLGDRFSGTKDALDESVEAFLFSLE